MILTVPTSALHTDSMVLLHVAALAAAGAFAPAAFWAFTTSLERAIASTCRDMSFCLLWC